MDEGNIYEWGGLLRLLYNTFCIILNYTLHYAKNSIIQIHSCDFPRLNRANLCSFCSGLSSTAATTGGNSYQGRLATDRRDWFQLVRNEFIHLVLDQLLWDLPPQLRGSTWRWTWRGESILISCILRVLCRGFGYARAWSRGLMWHWWLLWCGDKSSHRTNVMFLCVFCTYFYFGGFDAFGALWHILDSNLVHSTPLISSM